MKPKAILLILIGIGIILLVLSIIWRRKKRLRMVLSSAGVLTGLLPLLIWVAFSLFLYIKERPYIGNYEGDTGVQGMASLDMFDDNTFVLRSDSCSSGFVQGTWEYSLKGKDLVFESSSQRMGHAHIVDGTTLEFKNLPVCIRLIRELQFKKTGKPVSVPVIDTDR